MADKHRLAGNGLGCVAAINHLCFQQHSRIVPLSTFVFIYIPASFPGLLQRSFVFIYIPGSFRSILLRDLLIPFSTVDFLPAGWNQTEAGIGITGRCATLDRKTLPEPTYNRSLYYPACQKRNALAVGRVKLKAGSHIHHAGAA